MHTCKFYPAFSLRQFTLITLIGLLAVSSPALAAYPGGHDSISLSGRLFTGGREPDRRIEVRIEAPGHHVLGYAYTDGTGIFVFRNVPLDPSGLQYVVVELEGFKPYHELLDEGSRDSYRTIFLEPATSAPAPRDGPHVVDVRQLQSKIPRAAVEQFEKGIEESRKGNTKKAISRLREAVNLAPDYYDAYNSLGVQYLKLGEYREAESAFDTASKLNPQSAEPFINRGVLYFQKGESEESSNWPEEAACSFEQAVVFLESAVRYDPRSASAHHFLGVSLYKVGSYEQAEKVLLRALQLDDEFHDARLTLVNVYTKQGRYVEAFVELEIYLRDNPKSPQRPLLEEIRTQIEARM